MSKASPTGSPKPSLVAALVLFYCVLAWLQWFLAKRLLASSGAATNATYHAVVEVFALLGQFGAFALLPLASLASRAYQANDARTIFGLTGVTLRMGFATGCIGMLVMEVGASSLIKFFEDTQPLLPTAPLYCRLLGLVFPFSVVNGGLVALLSGCAEYLFCFAAPMATYVVSLVFSLLFWLSGDLSVLVFNFMINQVIAFALFAWWTQRFLRGLMAPCAAAELEGFAAAPDTSDNAGSADPPSDEDDKATPQLRNRKAAAADPTSTPAQEVSTSAADLLQELQPSARLWMDVLDAAGNNCMRNLTLASKGFVCALYATRLGNAAGSAHAVQEQIALYLGGFVTLWCIATTVIASRLLEAKLTELFDAHLRIQWAVHAGMGGVWFFVFGVGGPERVFRLGGVGDGSADGHGSMQSMGEHLAVVSTVAHWAWATHTVVNAFAAPLDIILLSLKSYNFLGKLYCRLLFLVILPSLFITQHTGIFGAERASRYAGIELCMLLTAVVRLSGLCWRLYWVEMPARKKLEAVADAHMNREIAMQYVRNFCSDVDHLREKRRELGLVGFLSWCRRPDGEMVTWCEKNDTTIDALDRQITRLKAAKDKELSSLFPVIESLLRL